MSDFLAIHHVQDPNADTSTPDPHQDTFSKTYLGFWIYLMTDCLLFGTLFATYAVLHNSTFGGPSSKELFDLSDAFAETMILLCSSVTCGLAMLSAIWDKKSWIIGWLLFTFFLGSSFLFLEIQEFSHFVHEGNDWTKSAFLSSFFTLVGTHGLHILVGLFWIVVMIGQILWQGINITTFRRLAIFSLFWHFLDLIWIFIFTFVYLMGVI
ncbi:MAG: cytochrome o ubiquinol oxidase subunit III [Parachlamydiaceae bacterium]|nr:cytochrome o ubiquinol oxidase subunit III [Parachlamydiaceae bacterium]